MRLLRASGARESRCSGARALLLLMPAAASPSAPAAAPKKKVTKEWRKGVPHLPAQTHASVNAALAGAILSLAAEDDELTRGELAKRAYKAVGSRENKAENVLCNLEYCEDDGIAYDPASRYGNNKTGPRATETRSPAAAQRARRAMQESEGRQDRSRVVLTDAQAGIFAWVCGGRQHPRFGWNSPL